MVFLISGRGYFTFLYGYAKHNREGGRKEKKNKERLGLAPSVRGGSHLHFLCILWANASVYSSKNSHRATRNADSHSRVGQPGEQVLAVVFLTSVLPSSLSCFHLLTASFCSPLSTVFCCPLLLTVSSWLISHADSALLGPSFPRPFSGLVGDLSFRPICVGFAPKQSKRFSDWHPPHTTNAQHRVTNIKNTVLC